MNTTWSGAAVLGVLVAAVSLAAERPSVVATGAEPERFCDGFVFTEDVVPANFAFLVGRAPGGFWIDDVKFYEGDYVPTVVQE